MKLYLKDLVQILKLFTVAVFQVEVFWVVTPTFQKSNRWRQQGPLKRR